MEAKELLNKYGYKYKQRGDELWLHYCPYCETETDGDYTHISFNEKNNVFFCVKCQEKGNVWKFAIDGGHIIKKVKEKKYYIPVEKPEHLKDLDKFHDWYEKNRGIDRKILKKYRVGKENQTIIYHYYNESSVLFNRKYRTIDKKQWQDKDSEHNYYGLQFVNYKSGILFVVEGEDDCHALAQLGFENVVSIPQGAKTYTPAMDKVNSQIDTIFMLFDNDSAGQDGAKQFAEKAGLHKCINVILPFKDARDCLLNGFTFDKFMDCINKGKRFELEEVIKAGDVSTIHVDTGIQLNTAYRFNRLLGGIRQGEFTVWTGHSGHGKTTAALNLCSWCLDGNIPCMIMSFENTIQSMIQKMIMVRSGENLYTEDAWGKRFFNKDNSWIEKQIQALNSLPLYFLNTKIGSGYFDVGAIKKIVRYATKFYNMGLFVIDHLHYFLKITKAENKTHEIDEAIREISMLARECKTHIVLVAHPYKTENPNNGKLAELGLYCIKGSSTIVQEASNFIVVKKLDGNICQMKVLKNRETGRLLSEKFQVSENGNTIDGVSSVVDAQLPSSCGLYH